MTYTAATQGVKALLAGTPHYVYVATFGCQQNEADSEKLRGMAHQMGYLDATTPEAADLILMNTCAIREHAEQKVLSYIGTLKPLKEANPDLVIGICGCMTAQPHRIEMIRTRYGHVAFTLDPASLDQFPVVLLGALQGEKRKFLLGDERPPIVEGLPIHRLSHIRAWVSIMYGCNNYCSYCIVPYVRGRERSRQSADIVAEVKDLIAAGCKDITLLGQNVNSYKGDCDFATLLEKIATLEGDFLVRFMTSHPKDVPDSLISVMAKYRDKIAPHFHLPLQSGSNEILRRMNRRYTREGYLAIVDKLRAAIPDIALSTDIIIGFPGETDEDFNATMDIITSVKFDMIYSFLYSPRKGTPAATMPDQVGKEVRGKRMEALLTTQTEIALSNAETYIGKTLCVLADAKAKTAGYLTGRTGGNRLVHFAADESVIGTFVKVKIDRVEPFALWGTIVKD